MWSTLLPSILFYFFLVLIKINLLNQSFLKKIILQLYLVSCSATQWGTSSVRRCACWLTRRCPPLIPDQNWPSPCPRRAPGTWSPSAERSGKSVWGRSSDILNPITLHRKKGLGFRWPAAHVPCLPWLNTWAGLQRRRCGTWRPRWRCWGSTWWVAPPLRSPRRPGGPSPRRWIAAGWRANRKIHFQVLWLTALKSDRRTLVIILTFYRTQNTGIEFAINLTSWLDFNAVVLKETNIRKQHKSSENNIFCPPFTLSCKTTNALWETSVPLVTSQGVKSLNCVAFCEVQWAKEAAAACHVKTRYFFSSPDRAALAVSLSIPVVPQADGFAVQEGLAHAAGERRCSHCVRFLKERRKQTGWVAAIFHETI